MSSHRRRSTPRRTSGASFFNQLARTVYEANRTRRTLSAVTSGHPARVRRLAERRLLYRLFNRLANWLAR